MPITKAQKSAVLDELKTGMKEAKSVVFSNFKGVSVKDTGDLRKELRDAGAKYKVAKKTLIEIAAKEIGIDKIPKEYLEGAVSVIFSMEDEIAAARIVHNFAKKVEGVSLVGAIFEGKLLSLAETKALATLPGKTELLSKLVFVLKSPISGFHGVLNNTMASFVRVLDAVKDKKPA
jgi:large subunit ribosomal protein L10